MVWIQQYLSFCLKNSDLQAAVMTDIILKYIIAKTDSIEIDVHDN